MLLTPGIDVENARTPTRLARGQVSARNAVGAAPPKRPRGGGGAVGAAMGATAFAAVQALGVAGGYVAAVRAPGALLAAAGGGPPRGRDDPWEILGTSAGALLYPVALARLGLLSLDPPGRAGGDTAARSAAGDAALAVLQVGLLYLGPLAHAALREARKGRGLARAARAGLRQVGAAVADPRRWRDYVVAPVSEELCFRGCLVTLMQKNGACGPAAAGALAPVFFGAAHLHHAARLRREGGLTWRAAFARVAFMFAYTTVFGWYACFLYIRTGRLAAPILAHALCNILEVPDFSALSGDPHRGALGVATAAGVAAFAACLALP